MKNLVDYIGEPALLEQTAEECMELAFACMKLARMKRGENKVHGHTEEELVKKIEEETADVELCISELKKAKPIDSMHVTLWYGKKLARMRERLEAEEKEKQTEIPSLKDIRGSEYTFSFSLESLITDEDLKKILGSPAPKKKEEECKDKKVDDKDFVDTLLAALIVGAFADALKPKKDDNDSDKRKA